MVPPRSTTTGTSTIDDKDKNSVGEGSTGKPEPIKRRVLPGPSQSPRDPNLYRVIALQNGMRIALSSLSSFPDKTLDLNKCASAGRIRKTGTTRSKCQRARSDLETPRRKRTRPDKESDEAEAAVKDPSCVDSRVEVFNKDVLHLCEKSGECKPTTGFLGMALICCNPTLTENLGVEGNADEESGEQIDPRKQSTWSTHGEDTERKHNPWNLADRLESAGDESGDDVPKLIKAKPEQYSLCSVALTLPWGPIFESDEAPGISELGRNIVEACSYTYQNRQEEHTTFVSYVSRGELTTAVSCLAAKFQSTNFAKDGVESALKRVSARGSLLQRLRHTCWNKGGDNLLMSPKRIKLLSGLTKEGHPIRRCAIGGRSNKTLEDIAKSNTVVERMLHDYLRNVCKPQYMTVAIEAPIPLDQLEELACNNFGSIVNIGTPSLKNPETHVIDGEPNPFDTPSFKTLIKVKPCPTDCGEKCDEKYLTISFPLPGNVWRNYRTRPIKYLSHMITQRGSGSLYEYLTRKGWILDLRAECSPTQFHRNQFSSLFEIMVALTHEGFEEKEEVLKGIFSYLKFLADSRPQKRIYKEIQQLQAIEFHALQKNLDEVEMIQDAKYLSQGLQVALSEDVILSENIMTSYNGKVLDELAKLLQPDVANFMYVSNSFKAEETDKTEEYLGTKYGIQDVPVDLMAALKGITAFPDFTLPPVNDFIPRFFCSLCSELKQNNNTPRPIRLSDDDIHQLWVIPDSRYKTRTGTLVHFVTQSATDIQSATESTLFYRIFKRLLSPALYPALLAGIRYEITLTDFGIMAKVDANADNIGRTLGAMVEKFHNMQDLLTEEFFESEKMRLRKKICCGYNNPDYFTRWLHTTLTLVNSWSPTDYLPVLDDLNLAKHKAFIETLKKDLYFMLLVVGNVCEQDAVDMCESIVKALTPGAPTRNIENIQLLQWPVGENVICVQGFNNSSTSTTLLTSYYQLGVADAKTVLMTSIIEAALQKFFLQNESLLKKGIEVKVGSYPLHNTMELRLRAEVPSNLQPEAVIRHIEEEMEDYLVSTLCELKPKELDEMKKSFSGACDQAKWTSPETNLTVLSTQINNLNMISNEDALKRELDCLKTKDVSEWYEKYLLEPDQEKEATIENIPERRKLTIVVLKGSPELSKQKKQEQGKKTGSPCSKDQCPELEIEIKIPGECQKKGKSRKEEEQAFSYILDLEKFRSTCFIYPSYYPTD